MRQTGTRCVLAGLLVLTTTAAVLTAGRLPAAAQDPLVYAALGDSYTSGPLVLPHDRSRVPEDCGQSTLNYPHLVAAEIGASELRDVSCGGASMDDLYEPQNAFLGTPTPPQLDALGPEVDVVTIGMGGNDVGFTGLALDCVRLLGPPLETPCTAALTAGGADPIADKIVRMGVKLRDGLRAIHDRAPNAVVLVVGYPTSLPDNGVACWPYEPILQADMPYLVAKFKEMNAMLASAAADEDATYVDIYTPSIGHDVCQVPGLAWINGIVVVPPSFPAHPNLFSYLNSAPVVAQAIRTALAERAAAPPVEAPSSTTTAPAPPIDGRQLPATGGGTPLTALVLAAAAVATETVRRRFVPQRVLRTTDRDVRG